MVMDWSNAFMNGVAKDGFLDLSITNYGMTLVKMALGVGLDLK